MKSQLLPNGNTQHESDKEIDILKGSLDGSISDEQAIDLIINKRFDGCFVLLHRYQGRLLKSLEARFGNSIDAESIVADSFSQAIAKIETFKGDSKFYTWLCSIAYNRALSDLRRKSRTNLSLDEIDEKFDGTFDVVDKTMQPVETMLHIEARSEVHRVLNNLKPTHSDILKLRDLQDQSYEEIAEELDIPVGTVRSRLHRARKSFKQVYMEMHQQEFIEPKIPSTINRFPGNGNRNGEKMNGHAPQK